MVLFLVLHSPHTVSYLLLLAVYSPKVTAFEKKGRIPFPSKNNAMDVDYVEIKLNSILLKLKC